MEGFKKKSSKSFRRRNRSIDSDEDSENEQEQSVIEDLKEVQKLRKRHHGVRAEDLNSVKVEEAVKKVKADPLKQTTGGFVDYDTIKKGMTDELREQIGTAFASETNRRDEDAEMLKYVEAELSKRKGQKQEEEVLNDKSKSDIDKLYELPDHLKNIVPLKKKKEDMISNQMLSGIPEVDLGIEAKIKNIEQTEDAKQKLILEKQQKKDKGVSAFVPTNYAVNFVQHNRFNIEEQGPKYKKPVAMPTPAPLRVGDVERLQTEKDELNTPTPGPAHSQSDSSQFKPGPIQKPAHSGNDKATDDYHFEKYRRQMRKY